MAAGLSDLSELVELHLSCVNLPKMDTLSHTDAYVRVEERIAASSTALASRWRLVGKTEVVWDTESPSFTTSVEIAFHFEAQQDLRFTVMDKDTLEADDLIGESLVSLGQIMSSRGGVYRASIFKQKYGSKPRGQLRISGEPVSACNDVLITQLVGRNLRNMDGLFGKSDPFFTIERQDYVQGAETSDGHTERHLARPKIFSKTKRRASAAAIKQAKLLARHGAEGTPAAFDPQFSWTQVFKSDIMRNNLNPVWPPLRVPIRLLLGKELDYDRPLRIKCFDWDSDGTHDFIGAFTTSLAGILRGSGGAGWELQRMRSWPKKGYKSGGTLLCGTRATAVRTRVEHIPGLLDFVLGGCEISLMIAVDFTGSNGRFTDPRGLHYFDPRARSQGLVGKNHYEEALHAVGDILAPYDHDGHIPLWGYGAKVDGSHSASHCFPLNLSGDYGNPEVVGIPGVLAAYEAAVQSGRIKVSVLFIYRYILRESCSQFDSLPLTYLTRIKLSGPTNLSEIIDTATAMAAGDGEISQANQQYSILMILTDGIITDMAATTDAIVRAARCGLSIIIIGIGAANFDLMEQLDGDTVRLVGRREGRCSRDIVQFVPMRECRGTAALAKEVLHEIPDQLTSFMKLHGIVPNPPLLAATAVAVPVPPGGAAAAAGGGLQTVTSIAVEIDPVAAAVPLVRPALGVAGGAHAVVARTVSIRRARSDDGTRLFAAAIGAGVWSCAMCTLSNAPAATGCAACGAART
jgi:hypothetical protein